MRYTQLISSPCMLTCCDTLLGYPCQFLTKELPQVTKVVVTTRTALHNWSRRCPMASSCLSVLCGTFIGLLDPNPCSCRRIMMVWSERRGFRTLARIPFAVTKRRRAAIPEILLSVSVGFVSGTTILGTIFDILGISVPGHQTGNR